MKKVSLLFVFVAVFFIFVAGCGDGGGGGGDANVVSNGNGNGDDDDDEDQTPYLAWAVNNNPSSGKDSVSGTAVDSTGLYVAGVDSIQTYFQWRLEKRSLSDGSLIWTINSDPGGNNCHDFASGVAVDVTGVYLAGNDCSLGSDFQWRLEKRDLNNGSLIWAAISNPSIAGDWLTSVAVDSTGVYIAGYESAGNGTKWRIEKRSLSNGSLIWTANSNPSSGNDVIASVVVDSTGIYAVGSDYSLGVYTQWRIEKRSINDGSLIWDATSNPTGVYDMAYDVTVDAGGIYITGIENYITSLLGNDSKWRLEKRDLNNGSLIWTVVSNPSSENDYAESVTVDSTGVYVAGSEFSPGNYQWRLEKRDPYNGTLVWTAISNPSSGQDWLAEIVTLNSAVYMVGDYYSGGFNWRIEKWK